MADGTEVQWLDLDPPPDFCRALFTPDGNGLLTTAEYVSPSDSNHLEGSVRLWDLSTGDSKELGRRTRMGSLVGAVAFSPDGALVAIGFHPPAPSPGVVDVWETATGRKRYTLRGHVERVWSIAFSPDGRRIASAGMDGSGAQTDLRVWDAATGKEITTWTCRGGLTGLAFRSDGYQLLGVRGASPESEPTLQIWDGTPRPERHRPQVKER